MKLETIVILEEDNCCLKHYYDLYYILLEVPFFKLRKLIIKQIAFSKIRLSF